MQLTTVCVAVGRRWSLWVRQCHNPLNLQTSFIFLGFMDLPSGKKFLEDLQKPDVTKPFFSKYWDPPSLFTPAPPTREGWERRKDLSTATPSLVADLGKAGYKVASESVEMLGSGIFHMVYTLKLEDTSEFLVRISFNFRTDARSRIWAEAKMTREVAVLRLLHSIPFVPNVIHSNTSTINDIGSPYMLLQRLPGVPLGKEGYKPLVLSTTDQHQERFVESMAEAFAQVFSITLSEIGTSKQRHSQIMANNQFCRYLESMLVLANVRTAISPNGSRKRDDPDLPSLLNRLRELAVSLIPKDNGPGLARIALIHSDPNADNILIHDGVVSGLIDWETSAALPAYLAARYPPFLRSDGIWDPCFQPQDHKMYHHPQEWPTTNQEFEHLRSIFRETMSKIRPEFFEALEKGEKLRQLFEWLEFSTWAGPTTWAGCDLWERATRNA
ncbi:kinase-like domain-containing protein [Mycena vulgaris]|nr:kinase-like domain-containing protein [Mycena vulgaris]